MFEILVPGGDCIWGGLRCAKCVKDVGGFAVARGGQQTRVVDVSVVFSIFLVNKILSTLHSIDSPIRRCLLAPFRHTSVYRRHLSLASAPHVRRRCDWVRRIRHLISYQAGPAGPQRYQARPGPGFESLIAYQAGPAEVKPGPAGPLASLQQCNSGCGGAAVGAAVLATVQRQVRESSGGRGCTGDSATMGVGEW